MSPDSAEQYESSLSDFSEPEKLDGKMEGAPDDEFEKLAHSLLEDDGEHKEDGDLINEAFNQGMGNFVPDMMFSNITKNFRTAKQMYGERLLRKVTGYEADYIERNINIPEFVRELKGKVYESIERLQKKGYVSKSGNLLEKGMKLASLVMYMQELDHLLPKGMFGEHEHREHSSYGTADEVRAYKNEDRFRDLALKRSIKMALRRNHRSLSKDDLRVFEQESKGEITVIYAVDASGSMRGEKIDMAKKAGVALAFKASEDHNRTGLLVFSSKVDSMVEPTRDFWSILEGLTTITAFDETNVASTIRESIRLFHDTRGTKHLIFLTDAAPTSGETPKKDALAAAAEAAAAGITISVIGIQIDARSQQFAENLAEHGDGNFYLINDLDQLDRVVLEDYQRTKR